MLLENVAVVDYPPSATVYVPVTSGALRSDTVIFDTGSSEMSAHVDLVHGTSSAGGPTQTRPFRATSDGAGQAFTLAVPRRPHPSLLGATMLGKLDGFTISATPNSFSEWPVHTSGSFGNAPFLMA